MNGFVGCAWIVLVGAVSMGAAATDGLGGVEIGRASCRERV